MSLELHPHDSALAETLWKAWAAAQDVELEATFKSQDLTSWMNTIQHLRSLGLQEEPQPTKLNIMVAGGLRFTLVGEGLVESFCKDNTLLGKPFHVVLKEKKRMVGTTASEVDWKDYGVRIKLRRELTLAMDDPRVRDAVSRWATIPKTFRYMKRFSFKSNTHAGIQFDLSMVKQSKRGPRGDFIPSVSFAAAEIVHQAPHYEAEVEVTHGASYKSFLVGIATLLRGLQQSFVLVRDSTRKDVLEYMAHMTGASRGAFPGPKPATLERANVLPTTDVTVPNLRTGDYNVTDKADGSRCLLVVMKSGRIFLVDTNLNVYGTDRAFPKELVTEWAGTVLDGEWVRQDAHKQPVSRFYAFDIYNGRKGEDMTKRPFVVRGGEGPARSRMAALAEATAALANSEKTVARIPAAHSLSIHMKQFLTSSNPADPVGIFKEAATMLDTLKANPPYHSDGLIFTPNDAHLPKNQSTWSQQFKWKPAEENTVDFLVVTEKERDMQNQPTATEVISTKIHEDTQAIVRYKTLRLFVGSNTDPALRNPRDTILQQKPLPESLEAGSYRPVEFVPDVSDPMASVCHLAVDDAEHLHAENGDPILSRSIVEMAYTPSAAAGWRWTPLRVRWDKTELFQRGHVGGTMNADWVANKIWDSIHNPVTLSMIRTGALEESEEEATAALAAAMDAKMVAAYYMKKAPARDLHRVRGLKQFHNHVKDDILLSRVLKRGGSIYDMTCGMAGDIHKWIKGGVEWVLGTDLAEKNLTDPRDGAYRRYLDQIVRTDGKVPAMLFVQANASQLLSDGGAGQSPADRAMLRSLWGSSDTADLPPYAATFRGKAKDGFDTVSCMFSVHYFFKDISTLNGWLRNISDTLRVGGYFVGCCFDGDAVTGLLQNTEVDGIVRGVDGDVDVWSITKRYDAETLPPSHEGLGRAIDVSFISIGDTYTEYLVSWPYLKERLESIGLELLTEEELSDMGLHHSTNMFSESYAMSARNGRQFPMTASLRTFSFLNRWFILRRRSVGAEIPYTAPVIPSVNLTAAVAVVPMEAKEEGVKEILIDESVLPETDLPQMEIVDLTPSEVSEEVVAAAAPVVPAAAAAPAPVVPVAAAAPAPVVPVALTPPALVKANGPIYKFYHKGELKDDLKIKDKGWRRWISTYAPSPLTDLSDASLVYPSLEAALTAAKYQKASNKPELGASLFGEMGALHQKYVRKRLERPDLTEKEEYELMEDEGEEVRKMGKPAEMKKAGAKFNEALWRAEFPALLDAYVQQRYAKDTRFRLILDTLKAQRAHLMYNAVVAVAEYGGKLNEDGEIEGENLVGRAYMRILGLYY